MEIVLNEQLSRYVINYKYSLKLFEGLGDNKLIPIKKSLDKVENYKFIYSDDIDKEENIEEAYANLLKSKHPAIFIYDDRKITAITKERSLIDLSEVKLQKFIKDLKDDIYYTTVFANEEQQFNTTKAYEKFDRYKKIYGDKFEQIYAGKYRFGTIAIRGEDESFLTTARGKFNLDDTVIVKNVDKKALQVNVYGYKKATLNAPLLSRIFENKDVDAIVHYHQQEQLPSLEYAVPGTIRDSNREIKNSFNILHHGCYLLFDADGKLIKRRD